MLNETFIATTAISSFNNAALYSPFFLAVGLLTAPLLWFVYLYAHNFESKFGWNEKNIDNHVGFLSSLFSSLWLMLFGGNYAVMRDGISLVPVIVAATLFGLMMIVAQKSVQLQYTSRIKGFKSRFFMFVALFLVAAASGYHDLWGMLLQISAVFSGIVVGLCLRKNISLVPVNTFWVAMMAVLVLMQPEFFRFGQLGNLTVAHLVSIIITGFFAITALVAKYVRSHNRIHKSAYVKLKWLCRIVSLLAFVLFILTESVPVFIGFVIAVGLSEALSIYHSKNIPENMYKQAFAALLICVGTIIICPALSGVGVLYLANVSEKSKFSDIFGLL